MAELAKKKTKTGNSVMADLEENGGGLQMKELKVPMLIEFDQIGFTIFYWKYYFKQSKEQKK